MENLKYYGARLDEFDHVLVLDADVILLKPIDELLDDANVQAAGLAATYDHELDVPSSRWPPIQGGYLLFKPNAPDYDALVALTKQGDFRSGSGWKGAQVGWAYGGAGPVGLLSFYYNLVRDGKLQGPFKDDHPPKAADLPGNMTEQPAESRMAVLDRSKHDVLETSLLNTMIEQGKVHVDNIASFHFTGRCLKPWTCSPMRSPICEQMTERWWGLRAELAAARGVDAGARCSGGYTPLDF